MDVGVFGLQSPSVTPTERGGRLRKRPAGVVFLILANQKQQSHLPFPPPNPQKPKNSSLQVRQAASERRSSTI
jgi:hypothetical protein